MPEKRAPKPSSRPPNPLFALFDIVRYERAPIHVAAGAVLGMWLGLTPAVTLHWWAGIVVLCVVRVNLIAVAVSLMVFHPLSGFLDPIAHHIGLSILTGAPSFKRLWAGLYHAPIITFTRFNNTVVMGLLVLSTTLVIPVFLAAYGWTTRFGHGTLNRLFGTEIWNSWTRTSLYRHYEQSRSQRN